MPKRKRSAPSPSPSDEESSANLSPLVKRQRNLSTQRLTTAQKPLITALRLGAGFERQKYSRRRKNAAQKSDSKGTERLDAEYAVLKSLDFAKIAEQHLRKTISKVKSLRDAEGLPDTWKEVVKQTEGFGKEREAVWLNVTARLYKTPAVKKVVDQVVHDLKNILGFEGSAPGNKKRKTTDVEESRLKKAKIPSSEPETETESEAEANYEDIDEEALAIFDARIAAPSSAEEDSEDSLAEDLRPPSVVDSEDDDEASDSESGSEGGSEFLGFSTAGDAESDNANMEEENELDEDEDEELPPPRKAKAPPEKATKSTFLPSLSHANYFSGSESDASDLDIDIAPKKNRRGQRARQKIWEQKFGEKAKHVEKNDRNKGWDPKRGAVSDDRRGGKGGKGSARGGREQERTGGNTTELGIKKIKRDDSGPLHPSWQAAKAAKEKKMDVKPTGTKVVFD